MMRRLCIVGCLMAVSLSLFSQARKPSLMVVPSENWCYQNGCMQDFDDQGTTVSVPDYQKALRQSTDLNAVITKIGMLMADRGFPLVDLKQQMSTNSNVSAQMRALQSKSTGASVAESPLDRIKRTAKCDITLEVSWKVNQSGPKKSITYILSGKDAYSNKQVAGAEGTGVPSFSSELPVLLEEAVINNMDQFCAQLQAHFDDMMVNGREVAVDVLVFDDGSGVDLESEFGGKELTEVITDWMDQNTVNHRFTTADGSENFLQLTQVRIPLYKSSGTPMDTYDFVSGLRKYLRAAPYNLESKLNRVGLGRCMLIIGQK